MKLNDITSFRLRGHEICKIYKGTDVIFNVCTGNYAWVLKQEINNPSPANSDTFGDSVSLYQDTLVVGTPSDNTGASNAGSVYVYTRSGTTWSLQQTINNPSLTYDDFFGYPNSLYQDTLVVGAIGVDTGATRAGSVYVYVRSGVTWTLQQTINNPSPADYDHFGVTISLYQDTLVVGIYNDDTGAYDAGSVYVYVRSGVTWTLQQTINNPSPAFDDEFSWSVSLYQDTLVVGTPYDDIGATNAGTVYVYIRSGNTWTLQQTINSPSPADYENFGFPVSLYQDTLVVGAYNDDTGIEDSGSVYVYVRSGTSWSLQQTLNNPSPENYDNFGDSVSLYQDTLVVGARYDDTGATNAGSVYVYTRSGTSWSLQQTLNNPSPANSDYFGDLISLYQDTLVIGAPQDDTGATNVGSVYVYNYEAI